MLAQDFASTDRGMAPYAADVEHLLQFPLFGQALAVAYNLPSLAASDVGSPNLVRDDELIMTLMMLMMVRT
jgi:ABC-type phosphate transport system substrate-binding protein